MKLGSRILQRTLIIVWLAGLFATPASGGLNRWSSVGPGGGWIRALAQDPVSPRTLYAGTAGGGIYKTTNGGDSWVRLASGLPAVESTSVVAIEVDALAPATVYAAFASRGVYKSTDGGASFAPAIGGLPSFQTNDGILVQGDPVDLAADPMTSGVVYLAMLRDGLFKTADGGASWSEVGVELEGSGEVIALAIDPNLPERVWVATENGLWRTTNGGASFEPVAGGLPAGEEVTAIAALPLTPEDAGATAATTVLVGVGSQAWVTTFAAGAPIHQAESFSKFSTDLGAVPLGAPSPAAATARPATEALSWILGGSLGWMSYRFGDDVVKPAVVAGAPTPPTFVAGTDFGVVATSGRGPWRRITDGIHNPDVIALAVTAESPGALWAATQGSGVFRLSEGAAAFSPANDGLHASQVLSLVTDPLAGSNLYAGVSLDGVHKSIDGGRTWTRLLGGLPGNAVGYAVAIDPSNPKIVYAGTDQKVWKSGDGGDTWSLASQGIAATCVFALAIDPLHPATVYAGTCGGGVYKTTSGGASWSPANQGLTDTYAQSLAIHPLDPSVLYVGTYHEGVFESIDGAASWTQVNNDENQRLRSYIGALAVGPFGADPLLAAPDGRGIFRSTNGAASWTPANAGFSSTGTVTGFAHHPQLPGMVWAASGLANFGAAPLPGVFRSTDGGASWSAMTAAGLSHSALEALAIDRQHPENLYAATFGGGVFRHTAGADGPCRASATVLCLQNDRFRVEVDWRAGNSGESNWAYAEALTPDTGTFWFFDAANIELVIKLLDARVLNDHFWVFYGALSDVQFTIHVTDTQTGNVRTYFNPQGTQASLGDTAAFPATGTFTTTDGERALLGPSAARLQDLAPVEETRGASAGGAACVAAAESLCLASNRFEVRVSWRAGGESGSGQASPLTSDTGTFWFFDPANVELVIKVLDARVVNGHFWVFYGALSDVEYTISVTDTQTGRVKTYFNPQGTQASRSDVTAF